MSGYASPFKWSAKCCNSGGLKEEYKYVHIWSQFICQLTFPRAIPGCPPRPSFGQLRPCPLFSAMAMNHSEIRRACRKGTKDHPDGPFPECFYFAKLEIAP